METVYVMTGKTIYRDMTQFWGKLFGINFALGVTTGITMEFQFGTNWAYYSHYVGDIFGAPLAIEGLMAFFLESTFIGLFFFGWDRLSKAAASDGDRADGDRHQSVGAVDSDRQRLDAESGRRRVQLRHHAHGMTDFWPCCSIPTRRPNSSTPSRPATSPAPVFVLAISSWYLLRGRDVEFAKRSFRIAAAFGFASACSVIVLGDESGYTVGEAQQTKIAAMEALWNTEPAPAGLTVVADIDQAKMKNDWSVEIPWVLGLIGTRSTTKTLPGIKDIIATNRGRIANGVEAVKALEALRRDPTDPALKAAFDAHKADLGFGLLTKKYVNKIDAVTPEVIDKAAADTIPAVAPMFWAFRFMVGLGFLFLALFTLALWYSIRNDFQNKRWLLRWALWFLPTPWIACELGWFVAEFGRQPWTIYGVLPTHMSVSTLSSANVYGSLAGFLGFYTVLLAAELYLMVKFARRGPGSLGTGRYDGELARA